MTCSTPLLSLALAASTVLAGFAAADEPCPDGPFLNRSYDSGPDPRAVATAELDGSGGPDLAIADDTGVVSVVLNLGGREFAPPVSYPVGPEPKFVQIGDFDGVLGPDLAVTFLGGIAILLNQGDGTFASADTYATASTQAGQLVVGDLDGMNGLDVATVDGTSVILLLNDGDGTFSAHTRTPDTCSVRRIAIGDLDGANGPDLVVLDQTCDRMIMLLNDGAATFDDETAMDFPSETFLSGIAAIDLDGLNGPDLVLDRSGELDVFLNNGDGTFASPIVTEGNFIGALAGAEMDGQDGTDLIISSGYAATIFFNDGSGAFAAHTTYTTCGLVSLSAAIADFDGNGGLDILTTCAPIWDAGLGTHMEPPSYDVADGAIGVAAGDLDGSPGPDLAVIGQGGGVSILLNAGDGSFVTTDLPDFDNSHRFVAAGDLDGTNGDDLVVLDSDRFYVLLNEGNAVMSSPVMYLAGLGPRHAAIGDLDGINGPDIAISSYGTLNGSDHVFVFLNNGDGTLAQSAFYLVGASPRGVEMIDLDGANGLDLIVANQGDDEIQVLFNNGNGTFVVGPTYPAGDRPFAIAGADLDGANGPDLAVANNYDHTLSVFLNNGDGTLEPAATHAAGYRPGDIELADLDGSNGADIVISSASSRCLNVLFNNGDGTFAPRRQFIGHVSSTLNAANMAIADFDGTGTPDVAVVDHAGDTVTVHLNQCVSATCLGDTNDDGEVDVNDLMNVILDWGGDGFAHGGDVAGSMPGDDPDGIVNVNDLNAVIVGWGDCP